MPTPTTETLAISVSTINAFGVHRRSGLLDDGQRFFMIGFGNGEGQIGGAIFAGVLNDHVDDDVGVGDGAEQLGRQARPVGDAQQRNFRFVLVVAHAGNQHIVHALILLDYPSPFDIAKGRTDVHRNGEFFGELDGTDLQNLGAGAGQLDHFVVGNPRRVFRLGQIRGSVVKTPSTSV